MLSDKLLVVVVVGLAARAQSDDAGLQRVAMHPPPTTTPSPLKCAYSYAGDVYNAILQPLKPKTMEAGYQQYEIYLPEKTDVCYPYSHHVGTVVKACDYDQEPEVTAYGLNTSRVVRKGHYNLERGIIYTFVYCTV